MKSSLLLTASLQLAAVSSTPVLTNTLVKKDIVLAGEQSRTLSNRTVGVNFVTGTEIHTR